MDYHKKRIVPGGELPDFNSYMDSTLISQRDSRNPLCDPQTSGAIGIHSMSERSRHSTSFEVMQHHEKHEL